MAIKVSLMGITNSGKSTIFNSMTGSNVETSPALYTTTRVNICTAPIFDPRLEKIHQFVSAQKITYATLELYDLPGISKVNLNSREAQEFFNHLRLTQVFIHVLRCFGDPAIVHPHDNLLPLKDLEWLEFELQIRDLDQIQKKLAKIEKSYKSGDIQQKITYEILLKFKDVLENMQSLRILRPFSDEENRLAQEMGLLTIKPVVYLLNVDEKTLTETDDTIREIVSYLQENNQKFVMVCGKLEEEIMQLPLEEQKEFLLSYGVEEPVIKQVSLAAFEMLDLITFYTVGGKENRAWLIPRGTTASKAAGVIHSDLEKGFIRAEVYNVDDLLYHKSELKVKEAGKIRLEGKTYVVQDGDILHIRFNI
ncbi:MAG: redox-regulated ATPase YchF [Bacteroidales bacterium]|nr:redox-regulated ATPase YchF [Bacteroidales bacterium]